MKRRSPRLYRFLMHLAALIAMGVVTGVAVYFLIVGGQFDFAELLESVSMAMLYVLIMGGMQTGVAQLLDRFFTTPSRWAVALRVALLATTTLVSFVVATLVAGVIRGAPFALDSFLFRVIAVVAFTASLIGNLIASSLAFYRRMRDAKQAALEAELRALRAQINPHFLFNALNAIAALIRTRPQEAEAVTENLADLFRYSLKAAQHPTVTLADELRSVELYLTIEQARFRDRLQVTLAVPETLLAARIPSLTLQPLVENAVKHGAQHTVSGCTVTIEAHEQEGGVYLRVMDTGPGFDTLAEAEVLARGTGLVNVRERLRLVFGAGAGLRLQPQGVAIHFPLQPYTEHETATPVAGSFLLEPVPDAS